MKRQLVKCLCYCLVLGLVAPASLDADEERLYEIVEPNLISFLPLQKVSLKPNFLKMRVLPQALRNNIYVADFFKLRKTGDLLEAERVFKKVRSSFSDSKYKGWIEFIAVDLLLELQLKNNQNDFRLILDKYSKLLKDNPTHSEASRLLYQIAFIQYQMESWKDLSVSLKKGLYSSKNSEFLKPLQLLHGELALQRGDWFGARFAFSLILKNYPTSREAYQAVARMNYIDLREGDLDKTKEVLTDFFQSNPPARTVLEMETVFDDESYYINRALFAEFLYQSGEYKKATKIFQVLANIYPQSEWAPYLYLRVGDCLVEQEAVKLAKGFYSFVIESYRNHKVAYLLGASRLLQLSGPEEAPLSPSALELRATKAADRELGSYVSAELVAYSMRRNDFVRAKRLLSHFSKLFPKSKNEDWANYNYIDAVKLEVEGLLARDDLDQAQVSFLLNRKLFLEHFGKDEVLVGLAEAFLQSKNIKLAEQLINKASESEELFERAELARVQLRILQGRLKGASQLLGRLESKFLKTKNPEKYVFLKAEIAVGLKDLPKAISQYEKALSDFELGLNRQMAVKETLGDLYFETQNYSLALHNYLFIKKNSEDEKLKNYLQYRIGECYLAMGDRKGAIQEFNSMEAENENGPWQEAAKNLVQTMKVEVEHGIQIFE